MSLAEELARARANVAQPTNAELIEGARWAADHPDVSPDYRRTVGALLAEIDAGKRRLEVAIRYAAKMRRRVET